MLIMDFIKKDNELLQEKYPNIIYRLAWYHKVIGKLYYATWNKIRNLYFTKEWVKKQNITYPSVRYWIEAYELKSYETMYDKHIEEKIDCFNIEYFFYMKKLDKKELYKNKYKDIAEVDLTNEPYYNEIIKDKIVEEIVDETVDSIISKIIYNEKYSHKATNTDIHKNGVIVTDDNTVYDLFELL